MKLKVKKPIELILFKKFDSDILEEINNYLKLTFTWEDDGKVCYLLKPQTTKIKSIASTIHNIHKFAGRDVLMTYDWYNETLEIC